MLRSCLNSVVHQVVNSNVPIIKMLEGDQYTSHANLLTLVIDHDRSRRKDQSLESYEQQKRRDG